MTQGVPGRAAEQDQGRKNSALLLKSPHSFQIISFCWTHFIRQYNINTNISSHTQVILLAALFDSFSCLDLHGRAEWTEDYSNGLSGHLTSCTGDIPLKVHLSGPGLQVLPDDWMCGKTEPSTLAKSVLLNRWRIPLSVVSSIPAVGRWGGVRRRAFWEHVFGLSLISFSWSPTNWQLLFSDTSGEMNTSNSCPLWMGPSSHLPFLCQYCPLGGWDPRGAHNTLSLIASASPGRNWLNRKIINA